MPIIKSQSLYSIVLVVAGFLIYSLADTFVKLLSAGYHISQIVFTNGFLTILLLGGYGVYKRDWSAFQTNHWFLHGVRGILAVLLNLFNVFALARISLTDFYVCVFTAPFWVVLFSALLLKDRIGKHQLLAIGLGFLTIVFMMRPGSGLFSIGAFAILLGAICFAISMVILRKMGPNETRYLLILSGAFFQVLVTIPFLSSHFIMPDYLGLIMFLGLGLFNVFGNLFVTMGFQSSPDAGTVAPYHYTQMIWGVIIGYLVFGDLPTDTVVMGSAVLAAAGIYLIRMEYKMARLAALET